MAKPKSKKSSGKNSSAKKPAVEKFPDEIAPVEKSPVKGIPVKLTVIILLIAVILTAGIFTYMNWGSKIQKTCTDDSMQCFSAHLKDCSAANMSVNVTQPISSIRKLYILGEKNAASGNVCEIKVDQAPCTLYIPFEDLSSVSSTDQALMIRQLTSLNVKQTC